MEYRLEVDKKYPNLNVFAKIFRFGLRNANAINYFGMPLPINLNFSDKNFFFRKEIDFQALKQRDKNVKVVAVFGPSTVQEDYVEKEQDTLVFKIQEKLKVDDEKIMVLNCGFSGFTLYQQFLLYANLFYAIKPEVVITFFGGVDLFAGNVGCELLLKNHAIFYSGFYEQEFKEKCQSTLPLKHQLLKSGNYQKILEDNDILEAMRVRLWQFYCMVIHNGGVFCPIISPLLACKNYWTKQERMDYEKTWENFKNIAYNQTKQERKMLEKFKAMQKDFVIYDGNDAIRDSKETLFLDWIHPNVRGNERIARYVQRLLKKIWRH